MAPLCESVLELSHREVTPIRQMCSVTGYINELIHCNIGFWAQNCPVFLLPSNRPGADA